VRQTVIAPWERAPTISGGERARRSMEPCEARDLIAKAATLNEPSLVFTLLDSRQPFYQHPSR
jgi:hypothetical protein